MKNLIFFLFSANVLCLFAQTKPQPKVDERTELMSVVFRLAEAKEYVTNNIHSYVTDIDSFFSPYKEHPVVKYSKMMRQNFFVGYDAVMALAVNLEIENGNVSLHKDINPCEIESRWQCDSISKYILLLNDFYSKTEFNRFFTEHKRLYSDAENNFTNNVISNIKFEWFEKFYGESTDDKFNIIISLANGTNNYGPHIKYNNGKEDYFAVIGTWLTDSLGNPVYQKNLGSYVIHEFNHSFCNKLIDKYLVELLPKAEQFNDLVIDKMKAMAYGTAQVYLYELLVRACVIKYGEYNLGKNANVGIWVAQERDNGFLWMENLNQVLSEYELNRDKYPTLQSFMPEIVKVQNGLNPQRIYRQWIKNQPVIIGTNIKNGAQDIDPNTTQIIVKFNKKMNTCCYGSSYGKQGENFMPETIDAKWNAKNAKEWILEIKLKPNTEYSVSFPAQFFYSEKGYYSPKETYYLDFKTK
ncbi:MAG: DUF4932 domain-containing protein [Paludibacter sp.]|jgi:hypothetical protein|nr:DUF4932 domain-containing protein [Paludibacter sp.]